MGNFIILSFACPEQPHAMLSYPCCAPSLLEARTKSEMNPQGLCRWKICPLGHGLDVARFAQRIPLPWILRLPWILDFFVGVSNPPNAVLNMPSGSPLVVLGVHPHQQPATSAQGCWLS